MKQLVALGLFGALMLSSCRGGGKEAGKYPAGFDKIGDSGRVDYMIRNASPDSVARFLIFGALGRDPHARIDTLATATNHAYETLKGESLETFSREYDSVVESLPLADKMKVYMLGGSEDPQKLGYKLGLEYMGTVRDGNKSASDIEKELQAFRSACGADTSTYRRFIIGFRTVLAIDRGVDVPEEVYQKFKDYE